jgi:hypothetical protein
MIASVSVEAYSLVKLNTIVAAIAPVVGLITSRNADSRSASSTTAPARVP